MRILKTQFDKDIKKYLTVKDKNIEKNFYSGRINMYTYNAKKYINYYIEEGDYVYVPITCFAYYDKVNPSLKFNVPEDHKKLFDYQKNIIDEAEKIESNAKTFVLPTGSGKSIIISHLILKYQAPTLLLLPTIELLKQQKKVLEEFGIEVGMYGNGSKDIKPVTVMTNSSFAQMNPRDIEKLNFDILIVDELQKALGESTRESILRLEIKKQFAFSATPYTASLSKEDIEPFFGKKVEYKNITIIPEIYRINYMNPYTLNPKTYTKDRSNTLDLDKKRLDTQIEEIKKLMVYRKNIMVLYDRVDHSEYVYKSLKESGYDKIHIMTGEMKDRNRTMNLNSFRKRGGVLVASDAIAGTGLDCPSIDTVCIFFPNKFDGRVIQMVGRGLRKSPGKKDSIVIDWVDSCLYFQYTKRFNAYKETYSTDKAKDITEFYKEKDIDI